MQIKSEKSPKLSDFSLFSIHKSQITIHYSSAIRSNHTPFSIQLRYRAKGYPKNTQRIPQGYRPYFGKMALYTIYTMYIYFLYHHNLHTKTTTSFQKHTISSTNNHRLTTALPWTNDQRPHLSLIYTSFFIKILSFSFFSCIYAKKVVPLYPILSIYAQRACKKVNLHPKKSR